LYIFRLDNSQESKFEPIIIENMECFMSSNYTEYAIFKQRYVPISDDDDTVCSVINQGIVFDHSYCGSYRYGAGTIALSI